MNPNNFLSEYSQELEPNLRLSESDEMMSIDEDNMCANIAADIDNYTISDITSNLHYRIVTPDFIINQLD